MKIAVLGAGLSGVTAARLPSYVSHEVTAFEKDKTPGGLAKICFTNGYLYDPHGTHKFKASRSFGVDFSICPKAKNIERNAELSLMEGMYHIRLNYPFENWLQRLQLTVYTIFFYHKRGRGRPVLEIGCFGILGKGLQADI